MREIHITENVAGFETPTSGEIFLDGKDMSTEPPYKRPVNMMFQSYALFPHMTVAQNIAFGLKQDHLPKVEIEERVAKMLRLVHMEEYAERKPHQLSGGQRQRVALARSLAKQPKVLLLDEPMGALDKKLREQMRLELVDIVESVGVTCVMVTHDQEEAMTMAERIAIMDRGEFIQIGGPREIYENPNCRFTAELIGSINMFESTLVMSDHKCSELSCTDLETRLKIYIDRTFPVDENGEKLTCNYTTGVVENIAYMGDISIYHVRLASGKVVITTLPNVDRFNVGLPTWDDKVFLSWDPESCITLTF